MFQRIIYSLILFCFLLQPNIGSNPETLSEWKEGILDIHFINTGTGNCAFSVLPDGTTLLIDAGEQDPTSPRVQSPRNTPRYPNYSKLGYEWQADYIKTMYPLDTEPLINYALITHYHSDHFGGLYPGVPPSQEGDYYLTGITGLGSIIPIQHLIDRGEHYPMNLREVARKKPDRMKSMMNYWDFISYQEQKNNLTHESFKIGSNEQFILLHNPAAFPDFSIRNVNANGAVWSGLENEPPICKLPDTTEVKNSGIVPGENSLSCGILIEYGPFRFFTAGDIQGEQPDFMQMPEWYDVEAIVAPIVGEVDVTTTNHHANRDAMSAKYLGILKPRVIIQEVWSSDHPGHEALLRMTSRKIWPEDRDLFATNMLEANRLVIGNLIDDSYKNTEGHIVLRVMPGGREYYIYILNQKNTTREVKAVYGPYASK